MGSTPTVCEVLIPCEYCEQLIPYELFSAHLEVCERDHLQSQLLAQAAESTRVSNSQEPADVAMRIVDVARAQGANMPDTFSSAREVCNFDLALEFVQQFQEFRAKIGARDERELEIAYHWTKEE